MLFYFRKKSNLKRFLQVDHQGALISGHHTKGEKIAPLSEKFTFSFFLIDFDIKSTKAYLSKAFCLFLLKPKGYLTVLKDDNYWPSSKLVRENDQAKR